MDTLDMILEMTTPELADLVGEVASTPEVEIEMLDDSDEAGESHVSDEMRSLALKIAKLGQQLQQHLLAYEEAKVKADQAAKTFPHAKRADE